MASNIENKPQGFALPQETGDSPIRKFAANTIENVVLKLHEVFPWMTADQITYLGTAGIAAGSFLAYQKQSQELHKQTPTVSSAGVLAVITAASAMDALDGSMARLRNQKYPGSVDTNRGQIVDVVSDRIQESISGITRALMARSRKDTVGEIAALANVLSNPLPSLARSQKEAKGIKVPESGKGVDVLGTRLGRTVLNTLALVFPEVNQIPVQTVLDTVGTVSNIITTVKRLNTKPDADTHLSDVVRQKAVLRNKALKITTGLIAGVTLAYIFAPSIKNHLNHPPKK